jgi:hypothetical protein
MAYQAARRLNTFRQEPVRLRRGDNLTEMIKAALRLPSAPAGRRWFHPRGSGDVRGYAPRQACSSAAARPGPGAAAAAARADA